MRAAGCPSAGLQSKSLQKGGGEGGRPSIVTPKSERRARSRQRSCRQRSRVCALWLVALTRSTALQGAAVCVTRDARGVDPPNGLAQSFCSTLAVGRRAVLCCCPFCHSPFSTSLHSDLLQPFRCCPYNARASKDRREGGAAGGAQDAANGLVGSEKQRDAAECSCTFIQKPGACQKGSLICTLSATRRRLPPYADLLMWMARSTRRLE